MANPRTSRSSSSSRSSSGSTGRTYPGDAIRGIPTASSILGSGYFNPQIFEPEMPQRSLPEELEGMRSLTQNEIRMQRYKQPQLIRWEGENALKRLQMETRIADQARPLLDAERAANPSMGLADAAVERSLMSLGPSRLETELERQAYNDLQAGQNLTGEEERAAIQAARAGMSARGLATGTSSVIAEVLNRDTFARGRELQRRGFAQQVEGMQRGRIGSDMQLAIAGRQYGQATSDRGQLFGTADMLTKNRQQPLTFTNQAGPYIAGLADTNVQAQTAYNAQMLGGSLQLAGMQHDIGMTLLNARFNNDLGAANLQAAEAAGNKAATGQIAGAAIGAVAMIF